MSNGNYNRFMAALEEMGNGNIKCACIVFNDGRTLEVDCRCRCFESCTMEHIKKDMGTQPQSWTKIEKQEEVKALPFLTTKRFIIDIEGHPPIEADGYLPVQSGGVPIGVEWIIVETEVDEDCEGDGKDAPVTVTVPASVERIVEHGLYLNGNMGFTVRDLQCPYTPAEFHKIMDKLLEDIQAERNNWSNPTKPTKRTQADVGIQ